MELRNLRYFLAAAREENMSRAADILHVTQPTLSRAIKALEDDLGEKLFVRKSFSISLTPKGKLLKDRVESLITMVDEIESEFTSIEDIENETISFGLVESSQIIYLAAEINTLKRRYPNFAYHITSGYKEQILEDLDNGIHDFAVVCEDPDTEKYNCLAFPKVVTWGAIMPADHPLAEKESINAADLIGQPLFSSIQTQSWNKEIREWAKDQYPELQLEGSFRLTSDGTMFVKTGLGIMLTYEHLIDCADEKEIVFRPLFPKLETNQYLIWNRSQVLTPIAEKFLEQIALSFAAE